jgi:hypothetical protein
LLVIFIRSRVFFVKGRQNAGPDGFGGILPLDGARLISARGVFSAPPVLGGKVTSDRRNTWPIQLRAIVLNN